MPTLAGPGDPLSLLPAVEEKEVGTLVVALTTAILLGASPFGFLVLVVGWAGVFVDVAARVSGDRWIGVTD